MPWQHDDDNDIVHLVLGASHPFTSVPSLIGLFQTKTSGRCYLRRASAA
jgi:hypothetical protein